MRGKCVIAEPAIDKQSLIASALLIRKTEERFLRLFSEAKLNGTVHTCLGQELAAVAVAGQLRGEDVVVSNHRCHGHYLALTGNCEQLISELMGKRSGMCGGIGSSQHICDANFLSNGVQGGIVPVSVGLALAKRFNGEQGIVVCFIGDGTLGEGAVYEAMNMASLWRLPILIACEHNGWAQSTPTGAALAGSIAERARAFAIPVYESDVWSEDHLFSESAKAIAHARNDGPVFLLIRSYRLGPHSKGDDTRDPDEIRRYWSMDRLTAIVQEEAHVYEPIVREIEARIDSAVAAAGEQSELSLAEYVKTLGPTESRSGASEWVNHVRSVERSVDRINAFFHDELERNKDALVIGEDILSPYGGAFKVTKNLSKRFPDRVIATPISELSIVGLANGLALKGKRPYVEIMFGDFVTLAMDQIVNHASKFRHMYNFQVSCPIVVRTPMGGRRGYGPTHSQSLERLLVGIDNVHVIATNALLDPYELYTEVSRERYAPIVVIENKLDYARRLNALGIPGYIELRSNNRYPSVFLTPRISRSDVLVITFGGSAAVVLDAVQRAFDEHEILASVLVISQLHPLPVDDLLDAFRRSGARAILTVEEGNTFSAIGSEIVATLVEYGPVAAKRIGKLPVPIPSPRSLEDAVLPNVESILDSLCTLVRMNDTP